MKLRALFSFFTAFLFLLNFAAAQTKTVRSLSSFQKIAIAGGYDALVLQEGDSESVVLETKGIDPDRIVTEVNGNTLEIRTKKGSYSNFTARLIVTYKSLSSIASSGSTDIVTNGPIRGDKFEYAGSGSGDFKGELAVRKFSVAVSGSCDMELKGNADEQEYAISGSGDIDASKLKGKRAEVAISGSGDVKLSVDGPVKTSVSGSGDVTNN